MSEELQIEEAGVYVAPVLAEAGDYAEMTQGSSGWVWDYRIGFYIYS